MGTIDEVLEEYGAVMTDLVNQLVVIKLAPIKSRLLDIEARLNRHEQEAQSLASLAESVHVLFADLDALKASVDKECGPLSPTEPATRPAQYGTLYRWKCRCSPRDYRIDHGVAVKVCPHCGARRPRLADEAKVRVCPHCGRTPAADGG